MQCVIHVTIIQNLLHREAQSICCLIKVFYSVFSVIPNTELFVHHPSFSSIRGTCSKYQHMHATSTYISGIWTAITACKSSPYFVLLHSSSYHMHSTWLCLVGCCVISVQVYRTWWQLDKNDDCFFFWLTTELHFIYAWWLNNVLGCLESEQKHMFEWAELPINSITNIFKYT